MLTGSEFITVYWLSGFAQEKFEVWKGRKDKNQPRAGATAFTIYLLLPPLDEDEAHLEIFAGKEGWQFTIDWFPGEEFPLKPFHAENRKELIFMSEFQRESVFFHLT